MNKRLDKYHYENSPAAKECHEKALVNGSPAWTPSKKFQRKLDGSCTRMFRVVLNLDFNRYVNFNSYVFKRL